MKGIPDIRNLLTKAEKEELTLLEWSDLMQEMGKTEIRGRMTDRILGLNPFPREKFVSMLEDKRLVVRLGALEILEEISGDHFDFDPWEPWQADPLAEAALEKWKAWAEKSDPESPEGNRPHKKSDFLEKSDFSSGSFYTALSSWRLWRVLFL